VSGHTRRGFLRLVAGVSGALTIGVSFGGCNQNQAPWPNRLSDAFQPNAFLQILPGGEIVLTVHKAEMGQGVMTGFATLVAEELEVDPGSMRFDFAEPHPDYVDPASPYPIMVTGSSRSLRDAFERLREAGASARQMLLGAAAASWGVEVTDCVASEGRVRLADGSRSASYGELAPLAASQPLPQEVTLKAASEWTRIGRYDQRVDAAEKTDGSAVFALDVQLPGMLTAVLVRCPYFGGRLGRVDATRARALPGVRSVIELEQGVAVLADGYWQARRGADALEIEWEPGTVRPADSGGILAEQRRLLDDDDALTVREEGERDAGAATQVLEADYFVPYLAHATMEPMNAVAHVRPDGAEIWAGNQAPDMARNLVARMLGLSPDRVRVHSTYLGGGFGRRAVLDYVLEAAAVSRAAGVPVKLIWSREDDMRHDYYRPAAASRFRAEISETGELQAWMHRIVAPSIMARMIRDSGGAMLPRWVPEGVLAPVGAFIRSRDESSFEGAKEMPYAVPYLRVDYRQWDPGVPIGVWRSVGHSQNAFFVESFVDEVAEAIGQDPLEFRLSRLAPDSRLAGVLRLAAERAGWGRELADRFRGIAAHESFDSFVANVIEVSVAGDEIRVHRVVSAVDCGTVVNPDVVRMQMESAVVWALSAALKGEITLRDGAVEQANFDTYPVLRIDECPLIEVHIVPSSEAPTGIGEPGVPPVAPAVANAVSAATGRRLRSLPLRLG
jgi:isoquinoline 1-oxidoreductase/isoquinoline 1-oxidoreductase beta subunit